MPDGDEKSIKLPELLAPCGSPEALDAALLAASCWLAANGRRGPGAQKLCAKPKSE